MKSILILVVVVLLVSNCIGQKKDSIFTNSRLAIMDIDSVKGELAIYFNSDSTIEIYGDTTKVLWMLQKYLIEYSEKYWAAKRVLEQIDLGSIPLKTIYGEKNYFVALAEYINTNKKYKR